MMRRVPTLGLVAALGLVAGLGLAGCGGSTTATPTADPVLQWCVAYSQITSALGSAPTTKEGATTSLNALGTFDQLWAGGPKLGYVTQAEADANRRAVAAYSVLVTQFAAGKTDADQEVKDARANLASITTADQAALESSSTKVNALCGPLSAPLTPASPTAPAPSGS